MPISQSLKDEIIRHGQATGKSQQEISDALKKAGGFGENRIKNLERQNLDFQASFEAAAPEEFQSQIEQVQGFQPLEEKGILGQTLEDFQTRGEAVGREIEGAVEKGTALGAARAGARTAGQTAGFIGDVIGNVIGAALDKTGVSSKASQALQEFTKTDFGKLTTSGLQKVVGAMNEFKKENPEASKDIEAAVNVLGAVTGGGLSKKAGKKAIESVVKRTGKEVAEEVAEGVVKSIKPSKKFKDIVDIIKEPLSLAEKRKALGKGALKSEGIGGIKQKLFGRKAGEIIPSAKIEQAADIISRNIKKPANTPQGLFNQIDSLIRKSSNKLRPTLKKTALVEDDLVKAFDVAEVIDTNILKNPSLKGILGSTEKRNFTRLIDDISNINNVDDIWNARIKLDKLTPNAIKNATENAAESVLIRQRQWLDARKQLNDLIDDIMTKKQGANVKKEFGDMSSLYEASHNISSNIGALTKAQPGIISKKNLLRGAVGAAGLGGISALAN